MWFWKKKSEVSIPLREELLLRMEAIGGQGAHSLGKIIAESAVMGCGYTGNHFSSFGSEKRGTPVKSHVRFSRVRKKMRSASPVLEPHILMVFHEALLESHPEILLGAHGDTDLIINTHKKPQDLKLPEGVPFRFIHTVDATALAQKFKCGLNAPMLGAFSEVCVEIPEEVLLKTLESFFLKATMAQREGNRQGFLAAKKVLKDRPYLETQGVQKWGESPLPPMGWANAPFGGVIVNPGNSILKDNSASRKGLVPRFIRDVCFDCGYCDMVCPDFCFIWDTQQEKPSLKGIDYQYCKACLKCVSVCPVQALQIGEESSLSSEEKNKALFSNIAFKK